MLRYTGTQMRKMRVIKFSEIIFKNFLELEGIKGINHTTDEIYRLLRSPNSIIIVAVNKGNIIGYLIAEVTEVNMRRLMHIYYLFTALPFRNKGVGTYLLNLIDDYASEMGINSLSLTYDTYNKGLTKFYLDNGFNYDSELRSYQRYDMLVKYL
jgi:GNAT superfamily N-acetyltransferase